MATELEVVADVLADPENAYRDAEQVAERVLGALAELRRRPWRYLVVAQDRRRHYDLRARFGTYSRAFYPTYAKGPFSTLAEAKRTAGAERRAKGVKTMAVQVFGPDEDVNTDQLKEVSA